MISLTPRQRDLLVYLESRTDGVGASMDEMRIALGLTSKSSVTRLLQGLEERGRIRRLPNRERAVEILRQPVFINGECFLFIPKSRAA